MAKDFNSEIEVDEKSSKINAAGLINQSLEKLWGESYSAMSNSNLSLWNRKLDSIWIILGGDEPENGEKDKEMTKINQQIYNTGSLNHKKSGFEQLSEKEHTTIALQYLLLQKKSLFLRRLQNKQGKGTAYSSSDEDDFD